MAFFWFTFLSKGMAGDGYKESQKTLRRLSGAMLLVGNGSIGRLQALD